MELSRKCDRQQAQLEELRVVVRQQQEQLDELRALVVRTDAEHLAALRILRFMCYCCVLCFVLLMFMFVFAVCC